MIVAESTEPFSTKRVDQDWASFLGENGYLETYFDGINTWFVREENRELGAIFKLPVNTLDDFVLYDNEKNALRERIGELEMQVRELKGGHGASGPVLALRGLKRGLKRLGALLGR